MYITLKVTFFVYYCMLIFMISNSNAVLWLYFTDIIVNMLMLVHPVRLNMIYFYRSLTPHLLNFWLIYVTVMLKSRRHTSRLCHVTLKNYE